MLLRIVGSLKKKHYLCTRNEAREDKQVLLTGTLDEWLSQRSAKPRTAVRIRQVPQE